MIDGPFSEPLRIARNVHCALLATAKIKGIEGSCLYAAILLREMVNTHQGRSCAAIRGGDGAGDGGYTDAAGVTHGHYWVEATTVDGEVFVLDVTADQFKGPTHVALQRAWSTKAYHPGNQSIVDQHVAQELA